MPLRIVYIDDEPRLCEILKENLDSASVVVETFTDANEAVRAIELSPPDLVFIDYRLTDTTGDKVADRISASIPKALLTGDIKGKDHPAFVRVFFKPYDFDAIEAFIETYQRSRPAAG